MSSSGEAFASYLKQSLPLINEYVAAGTPGAPTSYDQAVDLERYLYDPLKRFVSSGGKRIRPALCLLGAEAVGAAPAAAASVAAAVELFQAAALIHDDIADKSTTRRGVPCLHVSEGTGLAINAGDAALVAVSSHVINDASLDLQTRMDLLGEILRMEDHTLEGQALDLGWARDGRWDIAVGDYLEMARSKTAYYSAAVPLVLGAICGGGSTEQIEGLRAFGMQAGLAFQIQDDLLNLIGDKSAQGKDYRSDVTEGKRTLVMVWALEHLGRSDRDELVEILSSGTSDPEQTGRAVELAQKAGAIDHARSYAAQLVDRAKRELEHICIAKEARTVLISMSDFFIERIS